MFSLLAEIIAASDLQNCKAEERRRASQIFPGCRGGAAVTEESVAEQSGPLSLVESSRYCALIGAKVYNITILQTTPQGK